MKAIKLLTLCEAAQKKSLVQLIKEAPSSTELMNSQKAPDYLTEKERVHWESFKKERTNLLKEVDETEAELEKIRKISHEAELNLSKTEKKARELYQKIESLTLKMKYLAAQSDGAPKKD